MAKQWDDVSQRRYNWGWKIMVFHMAGSVKIQKRRRDG